MPNFQVHRALGWIVGLFVSVVAVFFTLVTTFALDKGVFIGIVAFAFTVIGSIFPDIDQSRPNESLETGSIPYRQLVNALRATLVVVVFLVIIDVSQVDSVLPLFGIVLGVGVAIYLFVKIPDILHSQMPKHRGLTHNVLPWIVFAIGGTIVLRDALLSIGATPFAVAYVPPAIAFPAAIGAVCHISLDIAAGLYKKIRSG